MPMMNSEARKRTLDHLTMPTGFPDARLVAARLADLWDDEADREDSQGNGLAAVVLHAHAAELRTALALPRIA